MTEALVIGGGPAGLMAAEALLDAGRDVLLAEAKPSIGRKFLMAGKSGLNLTKQEPWERFIEAYAHCGAPHPVLVHALRRFGPREVQNWAKGLGQELFVGSTGRVFPTAMKASPLLRSWLKRLEAAGLQRRLRWRWTGWDGTETLFDTPDGNRSLSAKATVLALGGASWARLGSDGKWAASFDREGISTAPFQPSNAGLAIAWSEHMRRHLGKPLKGIALHCGQSVSRGEVVLSVRGLEGGGIYPLSARLRQGNPLFIDLFPDLSEAKLAARLDRPRGKRSMTNHLRKTLGLSPAAIALLMEFARPLPDSPADQARIFKKLRLLHDGLRPIDEAISTAGGVRFGALDERLMLRQRPGVFCAGEMLDWDAPTGGYLLTGCLATGRWAGEHAARWLRDVT